MSKPRIPNQKKMYASLLKRLKKTSVAIDVLYKDLCDDAFKLFSSVDVAEGELFSFNNYPTLKRSANKLFRNFGKSLATLIETQSSIEIQHSNHVQDLMVKRVMSMYSERIPEERVNKYLKHARDISDFHSLLFDKSSTVASLDRISASTRRGIEAILSIVDKDSATSKQVFRKLSKFGDVQKEFKSMFGKDIENAVSQAHRIVRSEINMAYRMTEQNRWRNLDFIKGYRVKTSGSHPKDDICDILKGDYPKDFRWLGWHPNCMCYSVPIIMSDDEYYSGNREYVTSPPPQFSKWISENESRIQNAKSVPYFLQDNEHYLKGGALRRLRMDTFEKLKSSGEYEVLEFNEKNAGILAIHKGHNDLNRFYNIRKGGNVNEGNDAEYELALKLFSQGNSVILCDESTGRRSLDMILNGVKMDIKTLMASDKINSGLKSAKKQLSGYSLTPHTGFNSTVMIYDRLGKLTDKEVLAQFLEHKKRSNSSITDVWHAKPGKRGKVVISKVHI